MPLLALSGVAVQVEHTQQRGRLRATGDEPAAAAGIIRAFLAANKVGAEGEPDGAETGRGEGRERLDAGGGRRQGGAD